MRTEKRNVITELEKQLHEAVAGRTRDARQHANLLAEYDKKFLELEAENENLQVEGRRLAALADALQAEVDDYKVVHNKVRQLARFCLFMAATVSPEEDLLKVDPKRFLADFRSDKKFPLGFEAFFNSALALILFEGRK